MTSSVSTVKGVRRAVRDNAIHPHAPPIARELLMRIHELGLSYDNVARDAGAPAQTLFRMRKNGVGAHVQTLDYFARAIGYRLALVPLSRDENDSCGQNLHTDAK